ncbi:hypothetical protein [Streptomyces sp. NRRL S-475]|uniref:hypothetical protein n=1 Tax=Streptomyces sp. NRRL S-475 TaxID=1463910 RepID=UPI0018FECE7E|nr:hypothetical protein [Streptomyces sp. NRRL S-475]
MSERNRSTYDALYYSIHAEAKRQYAREWRRANADRVRAYRTANAAQRAAQARAGRYRRRVAAHLEETEAVYTLWATHYNQERAEPVDARALVDYWERTGVANTCHHGCGRAWREIVHAVPLWEGGRHAVDNLVPVCGKPTCSPGGVASAATATDQRNT